MLLAFQALRSRQKRLRVERASVWRLFFYNKDSGGVVGDFMSIGAKGKSESRLRESNLGIGLFFAGSWCEEG